jgi:hypothetical protein
MTFVSLLMLQIITQQGEIAQIAAQTRTQAPPSKAEEDLKKCSIVMLFVVSSHAVPSQH